MNRNVLLVMLPVILLLGFGGVARAELTPEQQKQAEALIKQFEAREFAARQQAVEKFIEMGPEVLPLVRKTLAETKDAEVKLRCEMVIKGTREKQSGERRLVARCIKDLGPEIPGIYDYDVESRKTAGISRLSDFPARSFSPNGEGMAQVLIRDGKWLVMHNGKRGPEYDKVGGNAHLSPDGSRVAYAARKADRWRIVVDGVEGPDYDSVGVPRFSPDGGHVAYPARQERQWRIVRDGREGKAYDDAYLAGFSPDGRNLLCVARRGEKYFLVIDGLEGPPHDQVWLAQTAAKVRYAAVDAAEAFLIEMDYAPAREPRPDGLVERRLGSLGKLPAKLEYRGLSPTGDLLTFRNSVNGKTVVVVNGEESGPYDSAREPFFSPDGRRHAFVANRDRKSLVIVDGKEEVICDGVGRVAFSPDSRHVAWAATRAGKQFAVLDGRELEAYEIVDGLVFSPDGRLACWAQRDRARFIVCDGKEGPRYKAAGFVEFSPDGRHMAYWMRLDDNRESIVCDTLEGATYDSTSAPHFSPDGEHLSYWARQGEKRFMVCDGLEGPTHVGNVRQELVRVDANGVRYRVVEDGRVRLMEVDWPKNLDWSNGLEPPRQ